MSAIYRFGDFELNTARFELKRVDACVAVQPKVLRLLQHLIEHRARTVSTEELLRVLWPDAHVGAASIKPVQHVENSHAACLTRVVVRNATAAGCRATAS